MNSSDTPSRITKAFGVNGLRNAIATESSTTTDNSGVATFDKGFPEVTMQPLSAGGIPPSGKDFNGIFYSTTMQQQWYNAGMSYPFNSDFSSAISGYPKGAIVPSSALTGQWLNLNESNSNSPESSTGASTGWVPVNNYGITQITLSSASVVTSSLQASKDRIILTGVLTASVNLILPSWTRSWVIQNNCTGNFTVTCRTVSGSGVPIPTTTTALIYGDGTNIYIDGPLMIPTGIKQEHAVNLGQFQSSLSSSGYQYLPGGRIEQWGLVEVPGGSQIVTVTLPTPFQNSYLNGVVNDVGPACIPYGVNAGSTLSTIKIYGPAVYLNGNSSSTTPTVRGATVASFRVIGH